ncbi:MAG: Hpt domain-containing protein, partial [Burkholderiaceae bacterium]|nr:Hpt domain-containing protein [Burkholderiaceae bacterium]
MTIDISQFFQVFFDEAEELLAEMERLLLAIDIAAPDAEDLNAVFRTAHSVKGGASTFGLTDMTEVTHILESLLDRIRKGEMAITGEHVDGFLGAKDILKMQLDGHRLGSPVDQDAVANVRMVLQSLLQDHAPVSALPPSASFQVERQPAPLLDGGQRYRLELPPMEQREVTALAGELGLLGYVTLAPLANDGHVITVTTHESLDDIVSICSFVLDPDQMVVSMAPPLTPEQQALEEAARAGVENAQGYGFFHPQDPAARAAAARAARQSLDLQYYIWKADLTGQLLAREVLQAADRGVQVR